MGGLLLLPLFSGNLGSKTMHNTIKQRVFTMHKISTSFFLSLLMVGHFPTISCSDQSFGHSFWDGVGIAAAAIAVGVGAAKLASWCFTETNPQLISRGEAEYNKALGYGDMIR